MQRWHIVSYPDVDDNKWWLQVDENLIKWQKEFTTEQALSVCIMLVSSCFTLH
jgi:hypothetical protein